MKTIRGITLIVCCLTSPLMGQEKVSLTIPTWTPSSDVEKNLDQLTKEILPATQKAQRCSAVARILGEEYRDLKHTWFGKNHSSLPIWISHPERTNEGLNTNVADNFLELKKEQIASLSELKGFGDGFKGYAQKPTNEIKTLLESIDAAQTSLIQKLGRVTQQENSFLYGLELIQAQADTFYQEHQKAFQLLKSPVCLGVGNFSPLTQSIETDLNTTLQVTKQMKSFVAEAAKVRQRALNYIFQMYRFRLSQTYDQGLITQLQDVRDQLTAAVALNRLGGQAQAWWQNETFRGIAGRLHTRYLQYEQPLRLLHSYEQQILQYETRIRSFPNTTDAQKAVFLGYLAQVTVTIKNNIETLEKRGWRGQKDQQILIAEELRKRLSDLPMTCPEALTRHENAATKVDSLEKFRDLEVLYSQVVEGCL